MLSSPGIGSGLDVNSIVGQLIALERRPIEQLDVRQSDLQAQLSGIGRLKSAVGELQSVMETLSDPDQFRVFAASSSDEEVLTATAGSEAAAGRYALDVIRLAENHRMASDAVAADAMLGNPGDTMTISLGGEDFSVEIGGQTLSEIRDAINAAADNTGVTATILKEDAGERLLLSGNETGSDNLVTVSFSGTDPLNLSTLNADRDGSGTFTAADLDAEILVEGQFTVTSSDNLLDDVIDGVTLNLEQTGPATLTIERDTDAIATSVNLFVGAYNAVTSSITNLRNGVLNSDRNSLLGIENQLRRALSDPSSNPGGFSLLPEIGVALDANGRLELDREALDQALNEDLEGVASLFTDPTDGIAVRLASYAENVLADDGVFDAKEDSINRRIEDIADQRARLERRVAQTEARLLDQYTALDTLLTEINTTSSFLSQQLGILERQTSAITS